MANSVPLLPPGHSPASFMGVIKQIEAIIGAEHVFVDTDRLAPYAKIMIPDPDEVHAPAGAIAPGTAEEVQQVMAICNAQTVPVWPISTGHNFGYGSAAPAMRGTVVLDLRRLDRILDFDPVLGTVLVEPGVTYKKLLDYIDEHGHPFWIDVPGPGPIVGPVGQALERGIGYTAYGDHFGHSCGFEVVLADGQVMRTGNGMIPGNNTFNTTKYGYGPYLDGIFSQSNFGVVTKMGLWLMPRPEVYKPFLVVFEKHDDLEKAVEICQQLKLHNVIKNTPIVGHILYQIAQQVRRADVFKGSGSVTDEWVSQYAADHRMGVWAIPAALYGTEEQVAADWKLVKKAFRGTGATVLTDLLLHEDKGWQHAKRQMAGKLDLDEFALYNWRGGGGSVWFGVTLQARGSEARRFVDLAKAILSEFGFDFLGGFMVQAREMVAVIDLLYDRSIPEEMAKAHACYDKLISEFAKIGIGVYRTNTGFMDKAAEIQGEVRREVNQRIKRALDPNGIIAPGKSGIRI